jgi:hypothetical protein
MFPVSITPFTSHNVPAFLIVKMIRANLVARCSSYDFGKVMFIKGKVFQDTCLLKLPEL